MITEVLLREGESIRLGGNIVLTIVKVGKKVRIGIDTPPYISIVRAELVKQ